jgi:hypothetical protein
MKSKIPNQKHMTPKSLAVEERQQGILMNIRITELVVKHPNVDLTSSDITSPKPALCKACFS